MGEKSLGLIYPPLVKYLFSTVAFQFPQKIIRHSALVISEHCDYYYMIFHNLVTPKSCL